MLGLDGIYTQVTHENMPLIRGLSNSYGLSHVPGSWIESIQIIKGSGSVVKQNTITDKNFILQSTC